MEVSSHGLQQGRVHGVSFDTAILTNLTREHLDYHGSMEAYAQAKRQLFYWDGLKHAVINKEDAFGAQLCEELPKGLSLSYGLSCGDIHVVDCSFDQKGLRLHVTTPWGACYIKNPNLLGSFNAENLLATLGVLLVQGFNITDVVRVLNKIRPARGRMQRLGGGDLPLVVVDYAHTPDALEKVLITLSKFCSVDQKLTCVFGCGGDRDHGKRPMMGKVAETYADRVILTHDNPRMEHPENILQDIMHGMDQQKHECILDRQQAICEAIGQAKQGDIILIAGKGHEEYQEISGVRSAFSDTQEVELALKQWEKKHELASF
jgi:UDP-N-acetylmuramoyl-L-alanyl-D-glutamate--2,6-diaminopimelate ligase